MYLRDEFIKVLINGHGGGRYAFFRCGILHLMVSFLFFCLKRLNEVEGFDGLRSVKGELVIGFIGFQLQDGGFGT